MFHEVFNAIKHKGDGEEPDDMISKIKNGFGEIKENFTENKDFAQSKMERIIDMY